MRSYELDANGHVNNSVYVAYAEEVATLHSETLGYGHAWTVEQAGAWVVRRHEITYALAASYGDELELSAVAPDAVGDQLGLVGINERFGERVVVGVSDRSDRGEHER